MYLSGIGAANTLKLCVNYTVISIIETFSEVYAFADKAAANLDVLKDFLEEAMAHPALRKCTPASCGARFRRQRRVARY